MAPRRDLRSNHNSVKLSKKNVKNWYENYLEWEKLVSLFTDPRKLLLIGKVFIILEIILNILVIERVPYTEIDWKAYMQEVEGFLNGTLDYSKLRGDTGPLVYPAGFVYAFSALYYITGHGAKIKIAQYIFAALYIILLVLVFRIYSKTKKVPPYVLIILCFTSYRVHSIFTLRLFNDPVAMVLLFASLNAFLDEHWHLGSILYSLAVSIKMNILLFAPVLLIAYLCNLGFMKTVFHLIICGSIQLILGLPFIINNPLAYIKGSFDFGRVFEFKWTVNWRFLPEHVFVHPYFHASLLALHILTLIYCTPKWIKYMKSYANLKHVEKSLQPQLKKKEKIDMTTMSQLFVFPMFAANFIGIAFSRSLHYQFYIWYYHTLPYIAWCTDYKTVIKLTILGIIELCWNTYPSTVFSSVSLHICHLILLYGIIKDKSSNEKEK
ncbi:PREDICTED: lethal(2)neighbour of Tid protein [Dufourea novaeangliae]|uniref:dolichyl-P-Man:Man5GlcNAc2-PP-dolichol alpha-1,3-mannosyltransferase n=1 Tax=Dufourea novaeangliae TaxID=178035 RepID=A0A154PFS7_DUFNO|nr:PREDICTED: lethal(2)neighbour of Tid protein [Dufourea novaeangliae]KZC10168.1 Lethal(2)neighbour of tid protein [Dufourea novaeangliae]